jgi:uncharacterized membrane protein
MFVKVSAGALLALGLGAFAALAQHTQLLVLQVHHAGCAFLQVQTDQF